VPTLHLKLAEWVRERGSELVAPKLRMATSAASPLDARVKALAESLYRLPLQNGYGLTETSAIVCQTRLGTPLPTVSVGKPLPGVRLRIVDAGGATVRAGETGALQVDGPNLFRGYYRNDDATRAAFTDDGWFATGDLGYADERGEVFVAGRAKDLIKRSGYSVHPVAVEAVLNGHRGIAASSVVGRPQGADEEVVAFVQLAQGLRALPPDLRAFMAQRLAPYEIPAVVRVLAELPTLTNGKVDKVALRRLALMGDRADPAS
jgi:acyl-coenzyme A synthetase/AMP-(fatty) acid ligase